jgi:hypothetical protein
MAAPRDAAKASGSALADGGRPAADALEFLTATTTSYFVAEEQGEAELQEKEEYLAAQAQTTAALRRIQDRLTAIEAKLGDRVCVMPRP